MTSRQIQTHARLLHAQLQTKLPRRVRAQFTLARCHRIVFDIAHATPADIAAAQRLYNRMTRKLTA